MTEIDTSTATMEGYAIVGPVRPWDEKHRDSIELFNAKSTFAVTAGEAWSRQIREPNEGYPDPLERSRRVQHWYNCGYRLVKARLTIFRENME